MNAMMNKQKEVPRHRALALALTLTIAVAGGWLAASCAYAGSWMEVSCVNPSQSAAPSEGWSSFSGGGGYGSNNSTACGPGSPMFAILSSDAAVGVGSNETLQFTPPGGSTLIGGSVDVSFFADGFGYDASGTAVAYSPEYAYNGSNVFFQCASGLPPCANGTYDYSGVLGIPGGRGGNLYLSAGCGGESGASCDEGGSEGAWSLVRLWWAHLLLENDWAPTGSGFSGSLLEPDAHGTAELQFTAGDPGPGVYSVTLQIDNEVVYQGTPDGNGGHCVAVGSSSGALMFDYQQPCKQSETVDIPVNTTALSDGEHTLKVTVTDAAQNSSVVYAGTITTANRTSVSSLLSSALASSPGAEPTYEIVLSKQTAALGKSVKRSFAASALTLSGELRNPAGVPAPNVTVSLLAQEGNPAVGALVVVAHTTSNAAGEWVLGAPEGPSRLLRVVYGSTANDTNVSAGVTLSEIVSPALGLSVRTPGGARLVFSGRLAISPMGSPRPLVIIETQVGREWEAVGHAVRVGANGTYRYSYRSSPLTLGRRFAFRAQTPATSLWQGAHSPIREAVVH